MTRLLKKFLLYLIRIYRKYLSPLKIRTCRYYPTCSEYAAGCIKKYGPFKGTAKACMRILKCNPFSKGGYDPV